LSRLKLSLQLIMTKLVVMKKMKALHLMMFMWSYTIWTPINLLALITGQLRYLKTWQSNCVYPLQSYSLSQSKLLHAWKRGHVIPVHKKGHRKRIDNYHPITWPLLLVNCWSQSSKIISLTTSLKTTCLHHINLDFFLRDLVLLNYVLSIIENWNTSLDC